MKSMEKMYCIEINQVNKWSFQKTNKATVFLAGMNPKEENSSAERRAPKKIEQADCPEKI